MAIPEIPILHFPEKAHTPLIRPVSRIPDEIIDKYSGLRGGREKLGRLWIKHADPEETLSSAWAVLENSGNNTKLTVVFPSKVDSNGMIHIQGMKFIRKGALRAASVDATVDSVHPNTEGITEDMISAAINAQTTQDAREKSGKNTRQTNKPKELWEIMSDIEKAEAKETREESLE